jgi:Reverse transcriptase (RNA-dependent DNA polymerase)
MVAFEILPDGSKAPVGHTYLDCHCVWDVKPTLVRKCRLVAGGHMTGEPESLTYASVVSRESVRLSLMLAALNGLEVLQADVEGAYLNAKTAEKLYTKCGPEFGEFKGRLAVIRRALYGTKTAAASWRATISKVIEDLGFEMCLADNDVWMRKGFNRDGAKVWEYVLVYSDDLLVIARNPSEILAHVDQHFKLKDGSVQSPTSYLGADVGKYTLPDGSEAWYLSSNSYVKEAVRNVDTWLHKREKGNSGWRSLKTKTSCMFPSGWKPELDVTPLLNSEDASYYQQQIGVLRWMCELGRVDINTEISMLAAFSVAPRQGHLAAVLHLFAYLKQHSESKMVFDPSKMDHPPMPNYDWASFYRDAKEMIPPNAPEPRGNSVQTTCFADSDHAGDLVSRKSRTGVLVYANRAPIIFYSKKQGSIETSSFGSEFSALKTAAELVEGLRYKLRMMGCPLDGPTCMFADNMSVVHNCSKPESVLKKKSNSIAFHYVRSLCATSPSPTIFVVWVKSEDNPADMFTKTHAGPVRMRLAKMVLFR